MIYTLYTISCLPLDHPHTTPNSSAECPRKKIDQSSIVVQEAFAHINPTCVTLLCIKGCERGYESVEVRCVLSKDFEAVNTAPLMFCRIDVALLEHLASSMGDELYSIPEA
jgi:hypothetical protein